MKYYQITYQLDISHDPILGEAIVDRFYIKSEDRIRLNLSTFHQEAQLRRKETGTTDTSVHVTLAEITRKEYLAATQKPKKINS